jgi:hypothetical protein
MELRSNLSSVVEETVADMVQSDAYGAENKNQFMAEMVERLSAAIDSDGELEVAVMQIDTEKGILAVKITENFKYPNGRTGTIETERIVIQNSTKKGSRTDSEAEQYVVSFYPSRADMETGENCYKSCIVEEGEKVINPKTPDNSKGTFGGWRDWNGYLADFSLPVEQDMSYYAAWN